MDGKNIMKTSFFKDQVAIITGASAGIGKALALQLAEQGARVVIAARRMERLEQVADECRQRGGTAYAVSTDVADETQCSALIERTIAEFGRIDILINNAGLAASSLFDEFPDLNLFRHTVDVNFFGAVNCTYYALPYLKQTKGRIIAISSLGGIAAMPYNTPYCASKFALHGFFEALRMELWKSGVSVTVVCPWWVATEFHEAQMDKNGIPRGSKGRAYYNETTMTAERCAEITLKAAYQRKREILMGPGKLAVWLRAIAPGFLDWITVKVFVESLVRRARSAKIT
jgi:short-subunit dehydrogenase